VELSRWFARRLTSASSCRAVIALEEAECCALTGTACRPTSLRRRASRPQLKHDPLGGTGPSRRSGGALTVNDDRIVKLLEEIRDLQRQHGENYKDAL